MNSEVSMSMKGLWVGIGVACLLSGSAWGNDSSYYGEGASVFAYKENRIRMVSEHIKIREDRTEKHPNGEWVADCTFVFENQKDTAVTIQMGFPDRGAYPDGEWTIQAFTTHIQGQSVPVTHKTVDPNHGRKRALMVPQIQGDKLAPPLLPEDHDPDGWRKAVKGAMKEMNLRFGAAYTWPVTFGPKERIVVKNTYRFGGSSTMGPVSGCFMENAMPEKGAFWHDKDAYSGFGSGPCSTATYVVTTGRSWHGTIGEAIIEFEFPKDVAPNHLIPFPPATEVTDTTVRWHFKDFEPTQEIRLVFPMTFMETDEDMRATIDFTSVDQVKRWIQFGKDNGFKASVFQRMAELQAYSFGLRKDDTPKPPVFDDFLLPFSSKVQQKKGLKKVQHDILEALKSAVVQ